MNTPCLRFALILALGVASFAACSGSAHTSDQQAASATATPPAAVVADAGTSTGAANEVAPTSTPDAASSDVPAVAATVSSDSSSAPVASADTACPLIGSDKVETVMHLQVKSIESNDSEHCTFHFKGDYHGDLEVAYFTSGGKEELESIRAASGAAKTIFGTLLHAASAPPGAMGAVSATAPPGVPQVGDDQTFMSEGPVTQFYATHGDGYVEVDGGFFADGVTGWTALPDIARQIIATR